MANEGFGSGPTDIAWQDQEWIKGGYGQPEQAPVDVLDAIAASQPPDNEAKPVFEVGGSSGRTNQVTIGTAATIIAYRNECRKSIKVTNLGATDVWIGFSPSVGVNTGDLLPGSRGSLITIPSTLDIYGIVGAGTQAVSFMEISE
jgi:hypothetical protein